MLHATLTSQSPPETTPVPFSRSWSSSDGIASVQQAITSGNVKAGGPSTKECERQLTRQLNARSVVMVQSCTSALELSALLLGIEPGDEVIMPSFGFASAANAFVLRGGVPVFVDIVPGTLTADPEHVAAAITPRTKAIVPVHYAGVAAGMSEITALAAQHGIPIIEDAAQGLGASYRDAPLGSIGALGAISFDATKNVSCGAGGALVVNDPALMDRAEWLRDCGTDRAGFSRGTVDRYRWIDAGTNAALNELAAAYLAPQLAHVAETTAERRVAWDRYHAAFEDLEAAGLIARPVVPADCVSNAHAYFVMTRTPADRSAMIAGLARRGIQAAFHFVPLHSAPAGQRFGRTDRELHHTDSLSARLVRLPLWQGISDVEVDRVVRAVRAHLGVKAAA